MEKKNEYKRTLEAYIDHPEQLIITRYTEVEWREDGPYSTKTGKKVAVVSSPRDMKPKK